MSEVITNAVAGAAVAMCTVAAGVVVEAGRATYRAFAWLSEAACKEMDALAKELSDPVPTFSTTNQARAEFEEKRAKARSLAAKSLVLNQQSDMVVGILALRHSTLGAFVERAQWMKLERAFSRKSFAAIVETSAKEFTRANAAYVRRSIIEVANSLGFTVLQRDEQKNGTQRLVVTNAEGRALVAEVRESDDGALINLDMTGFGDGSCHPVMDRILTGLASKNIRLDQLKRRSHYRREGALMPAVNEQGNEQTRVSQRGNERLKRDAERNRRRHVAARRVNITHRG